jgi:hypothetical protein
MQARILMSAGFLIGVACHLAIAQKPPVKLKNLGVDFVSIEDGLRLFGSVFRRHKDGSVTLAVQRVWLQKAHPDFYKETSRQEIEDHRETLVLLQKRIANWLKEKPGDKRLQDFLAEEQARVEKQLSKKKIDSPEKSPQFMLLKIPARQIGRSYLQSPQRKQVVLAAWREKLTDVETRSVQDLLKELREKKVVVGTERIDLTDRLPLLSENDRQWAARQAIVAFQLPDRLEFQGTGDLIVRKGKPEEAANVQELLKGALGGDVQKLLNDALGTTPKANKKQPAWLETARKTAKAEGVNGFRVTRSSQNLAAKRVSVESRFLARMPDGSWETVWKHLETMDASKKNPAREAIIKDDPQVKKVLAAAKLLGLVGNQDALQMAVRFGASTMLAQEAADKKFEEFRNRFTRRLDGPPIP